MNTFKLLTSKPLNSKPLVTFETVIAKVRVNQDTHAKFVNTLSLLEYIGARKIIKSQNEADISIDLLAHAAEEIRHAQMLKKIALKMSEGKLDSYQEEHLLCGNAGRAYIQAIDHGVEAEMTTTNPWTNYLIATLLIEERANVLYPFYETILAECGHPGILKAIVREENAHLRDILNYLEKQNPKNLPSLEKLRGLEERAFSKFMEAIEETV